MLETPLVCAKCGHTNTAGSRFCSACAAAFPVVRPPPSARLGPGRRTHLTVVAILGIVAMLLIGGDLIAGHITLAQLMAPTSAAMSAPAVSRPAKYSRTQLTGIFFVRSQVLAVLGQPDRTQALGDGTEFWYYDGVSYDPVNNHPDNQIQIVMDHAGKVTSVNFY
jgi:hypothetical protein